MNRTLFDIEQTERQRILKLHEDATNKYYMIHEQSPQINNTSKRVGTVDNDPYNVGNWYKSIASKRMYQKSIREIVAKYDKNSNNSWNKVLSDINETLYNGGAVGKSDLIKLGKLILEDTNFFYDLMTFGDTTDNYKPEFFEIKY